MTCIIGLVDNGHVYMGCDSRLNRGWMVAETRTSGKLVSVGEMLIGVAGATRGQNLIAHHFTAPERGVGESDDGYIEGTITAALQQLMERHDYDFAESELLIGYRGHLYRIGCDYGCSEPAEGVAGIGAGGSYAVGAVLAFLKAKWQPERAIMDALEIAGQSANGVAAPYRCEVIG